MMDARIDELTDRVRSQEEIVANRQEEDVRRKESRDDDPSVIVIDG